MKLSNTDLPDEIGGILGVIRRIRIATRPTVTVCDNEPDVEYPRRMAIIYGTWAVHDADPRDITAAMVGFCSGPRYTITHRPTGRLVVDGLTLAAAIGLIERILPLPTFRTHRQLWRKPELLAQLRAAVETFEPPQPAGAERRLIEEGRLDVSNATA